MARPKGALQDPSISLANPKKVRLLRCVTVQLSPAPWTRSGPCAMRFKRLLEVATVWEVRGVSSGAQ